MEPIYCEKQHHGNTRVPRVNVTLKNVVNNIYNLMYKPSSAAWIKYSAAAPDWRISALKSCALKAQVCAGLFT